MIFRQFFDPMTRRLSYLFADPVTRTAAVVDPMPATVDNMLETIAGLGLSLQYILVTCIHLDHEHTVLALKAVTHGRVVLHEWAPGVHSDLRTREGDSLYLGEETVKVIHTPGQSPCAVTYQWRDRLFTGETLLAGGVGVCAPQSSNVTQLYQSITSRLLTFPGEYLVYPGREFKGRRMSSVEEIRRCCHWFYTGRRVGAFARACQRMLPNWSPDANEEAFISGTSADIYQGVQ
ncbi:metallo-beta-lactamase family protein [Acidithiobacillus ferrivorans SS3]|uniref:Metallo-beta-lactamase family protein n=1 Tax=Acidithiobacillus ferrivorans SS3 TaxID=743299 RepID=G0JKS6_9PROT|nr:MBL fold metallo-hydrolase [Acidithiobacillus ferrivorans]AEM46822.1 metallo-beta-lactamase family protein [Acidithiobacillus ferrivorans SS3]OFA15931.1 hypothetical protein A4U49_10005 [Acidithiobacillus ferrivorans]